MSNDMEDVKLVRHPDGTISEPAVGFVEPASVMTDPAPEDEQDIDPENPDAEVSMTEVISKINLDQETPEMLEQLMSEIPEEKRATIREALESEFRSMVAQSRMKHIAFVRMHMGEDAEVKFADAVDGETYFVSFLLKNPKKQHNIFLPPLQIGGREEVVRPGRVYAATGKEVRLLERVLASKRLEILNLTPKRDGLMVSVHWVVENWGTLFPSKKEKKRDAFAKYRDDELREGPDLATVVLDQDPEKFVSGDTVQQHYQGEQHG